MRDTLASPQLAQTLAAFTAALQTARLTRASSAAMSTASE